MSRIYEKSLIPPHFLGGVTPRNKAEQKKKSKEIKKLKAPLPGARWQRFWKDHEK